MCGWSSSADRWMSTCVKSKRVSASRCDGAAIGFKSSDRLPSAIKRAETVLQDLYTRAQREPVDSERVHIALQELDMEGNDVEASAASESKDELRVRTARGAVRARGSNQTEYLHNIRSHDLTFGIGPAGTGKTYLAVACAVEALQSEMVRRIVLVRPAVEAGERLGFLPGDLSQKVDPYLRPMYDALYEMLGFERVAKSIERNVIEVAPLAFMRGRSLNDSFVILDEAQNTTNEQMKMFLTRIGFGSKAVVTGDITQVDLPNSKQSGLRTVIDIPARKRGIAFTMFNSRDVVRHPLVQRIVQAYEAKTPDDGNTSDRRLGLSAETARNFDVSYGASAPLAPRRAQLSKAVCAALRHRSRAHGPGRPRTLLSRAPRGPSISICVVGAARSRTLNARYRRKDRPTNVFSFDGAGLCPDGRNFLGEAWSFVRRSSPSRPRSQRKTRRSPTGPTSRFTACCICSALITNAPRRRGKWPQARFKSLIGLAFRNPYA